MLTAFQKIGKNTRGWLELLTSIFTNVCLHAFFTKNSIIQFDLKTESGYTNSINIYLFLTGAILYFLCPKRNFGRHIVMICVKLAIYSNGTLDFRKSIIEKNLVSIFWELINSK